MSDEVTRVFVYVTLKPGGCNHYIIRDSPGFADIVPARVTGRLYRVFNLPVCLVPDRVTAVTANWDTVHGYVATFTNRRILERLDRLEGVDTATGRGKGMLYYDRLTVNAYAHDGGLIGESFIYATSRLGSLHVASIIDTGQGERTW